MAGTSIGALQLQAFAADLQRAAAAAPARVYAVVNKVAHDIQADAQRLAPVDTGFLRSSIGVDVRGNGATVTATIAPTADYADYVEYGTSRMPPRPFMQPAFDRNIPKLQAALRATLGGG